MVDPERLLNGGTDFERRLLHSGMAERPSSALTRRMALGVGVGGALTYSSTAKALMQTWWGKMSAVLTVGAGVAGAVSMTAVEPAGLESSTGAEPPAAVAVAVEPPVTPDDGVGNGLAVGDASGEAEPLVPEAEVSEQLPEPAKIRRSQAPAAAKSTLAQEIKLLDRARALVHRGNAAGAMAVLKVYEGRYPKGVLQREARVLRQRAQNQ